VDFDADGQATVFIGGHAVVSGSEARTLDIATDSAGVDQITLSAGSGTLTVTDDVGGELGGVIQGRETVRDWLADLDDFATTLAATVNAQHAAGFDANGAAGGAVFTLDASAPAASLAIDPALADDPDLLAVASSATAAAGDSGNLESLLALEDGLDYGGGSGGDALSSLESRVGSDTATASADAEVYADQLSDLDTMRDAVSQVDTDEEAVQLITFQTAYRAAARVLAAGDEMLQTLMSIGA
jgi:flagellar hook-associated protein 1 FlgK